MPTAIRRTRQNAQASIAKGVKSVSEPVTLIVGEAMIKNTRFERGYREEFEPKIRETGSEKGKALTGMILDHVGVGPQGCGMASVVVFEAEVR